MRTLITTFILIITYFSSHAASEITDLSPRDWQLKDNSIMVNGTLLLVKEGIAIIDTNEGQWAIEIKELHWKDRKYIISHLPALQASAGFGAKDSANLVFRLLTLLLLVTVATVTMITAGDSGIRVSSVLFISTMLLCLVFTACDTKPMGGYTYNELTLIVKNTPSQ